MKPYNIAVCFSGESRTWRNTVAAIKYYFSSDIHTFTFFGHTWDDSFYNKENRQVSAESFTLKKFLSGERRLKNQWQCYHDPIRLKNEMTDELGITNLLVENKNVITDVYGHGKNLIYPTFSPRFPKENAVNYTKPATWAHMSYSMMRANELKSTYELENDIQFDIVVRARFDTCFEPNIKFEHILQKMGPVLPTALYCETHYFPNEFFLPHVNEVTYYGTSRVMNIVDGFFRYFVTGKFWEMLDENWNDGALKNCGYNVNLYKWLTMKNILLKYYYFPYIVFRKTAEHLNWPENWEEIKKIHFQT